MQAIGIEKFAELVIDRNIESGETVLVKSDELLNLLDSTIKLKEKITDYKKEIVEKDFQIRKLRKIINKQYEDIQSKKQKIKQICEIEKIQRNSFSKKYTVKGIDKLC